LQWAIDEKNEERFTGLIEEMFVVGKCHSKKDPRSGSPDPLYKCVVSSSPMSND
jgi:hypothetical protein